MDLFKEVNKHPYFIRFIPPRPKSTDGPTMIAIFEDALSKAPKRLSLEDQLATACAVTGVHVWQAVFHFGMQPDADIIVSGGGLKNQSILAGLTHWMRDVHSSDEFGVPSDAKEAIAFALLGAATLDGVPSNVPSVTGARRSVVLGSITPKP
jgi:anhydro-N-acetylmuramic acid kinase